MTWRFLRLPCALCLAAGWLSCAGPGAFAPPPATEAPPPVDTERLPAVAPEPPAGPGSRSLSPRKPPATAYASRPPVTAQGTSLFRDEARAGVVRRLRAVASRGGGEVTFDERLDAALDDLAGSLRERETPHGEAVEFLLTYHGIVAPYPALGTLSAPPGRLDEAMAGFAPLIAELRRSHSVFGVGMDSRSSPWTIIIGWLQRSVEIEPVPREIRLGASAPISARVLGTFSRPNLVVTVPSGQVVAAPTSSAGSTLTGQIACDRGPGRYQVEIMASNEGGPAVVANFPVYCGVQAPRRWVGPAGYSARSLRAPEAEVRLLELLNRARRSHGLAPVAPDLRLAQVARQHGQDMHDNGYVGHISPRTGSPRDRVRVVGLDPQRLAENLGRGSSVEEIHQGLMSSPSHRGAILDGQFTHVGIGIVVTGPAADTPIIYAVQVFR